VPPRSPTPRGPVWTEGEVNMPEGIPISTDKKCPACGSTDVHEVPANIRTRTQPVRRPGTGAISYEKRHPAVA
jgi:hypothetical protein